MNIKNTLILIGAISSLYSCKSDDTPSPRSEGNFVVAVTPVANEGVADYLITTSSLDTGTISNAGQGVEQDGTYRYYVTYRNRLYSMLYGQGDPGAVTVYQLQNGSLSKLANSVTETVHAFAPVDDDILLVKVPRSNTNPVANWYKFNTESLSVTEQGDIHTGKLRHNTGEQAFFSWVKQVGDKVFAPYLSVKACCEQAFGTAYPDSAWVAVYNYPDMTLETIIADDRTSFIGRYFTDGLELTENGDVYAFSSAIATKDGTAEGISTNKPSAVTRINAGTLAFDSDYFFNFEEISGGLNITNWTYLGQNKFIVFSNTKSEKSLYGTGNIVDIIDVVEQTYQKVSGLPNDVKSITGTNNYAPKDGKTGYIGVNLTSGIGYIYKIDAPSASATQGARVEGGTITAIEHFDS